MINYLKMKQFLNMNYQILKEKLVLNYTHKDESEINKTLDSLKKAS